MDLYQNIINLKGQLIAVHQKRDALGRFLPGAVILRGSCILLGKGTGPIISHHYDKTVGFQMVSVHGALKPKFISFYNTGEKLTETEKKNLYEVHV